MKVHYCHWELDPCVLVDRDDGTWWKAYVSFQPGQWKEWSYAEVWWKGGYTVEEAEWRDIWPESARAFDRWILPLLQGEPGPEARRHRMRRPTPARSHQRQPLKISAPCFANLHNKGKRAASIAATHASMSALPP